MTHAISWFEIPCSDLDRATNFYETIFKFKMGKFDLQNLKMRLFPVDPSKGEIGGAIIKEPSGFYNSSEKHGPLIYLNANPSIDNVLNKVEAGGGSIVVPKTQVSDEIGFMAVIKDTEGNRIGLMSKQ